MADKGSLSHRTWNQLYSAQYTADVAFFLFLFLRPANRDLTTIAKVFYCFCFFRSLSQGLTHAEVARLIATSYADRSVPDLKLTMTASTEFRPNANYQPEGWEWDRETKTSKLWKKPCVNAYIQVRKWSVSIINRFCYYFVVAALFLLIPSLSYCLTIEKT